MQKTQQKEKASAKKAESAAAAARTEANDNKKYLRTMGKWFERLESEPDFAKLTELFEPILPLVLLIWRSSQHNILHCWDTEGYIFSELDWQDVRHNCSAFLEQRDSSTSFQVLSQGVVPAVKGQ